MSDFSEEELCVTIDFLNSFPWFKDAQLTKVKSYQEFKDGQHIQVLLYQM